MSNVPEHVVADQYNFALSLHGELGVDREAFARHLECVAVRCLGNGASDHVIGSFISTLHTDDLFLSLACAQSQQAGWERFHELYQNYLVDLCHYLSGHSSIGAEFGESLWIELFLPDRSGKSRIASYDGRSSLKTWLRVIVSNRIINARQEKVFRIHNLDDIPEPADPGALQNLEARLIQSRYEATISQCLERASRHLTAQERILVLLRYGEGRQLGAIARLFSVHQSTITRQLDRALIRWRDNVISLLSAEYGLSDAAIEECLNASNCFTSISVLGFLKHPVAANKNGQRRTLRRRGPHRLESDLRLVRAVVGR